MRARTLQQIVDDGRVSRALVEQVMEEFYCRVRRDEVLGPAFARAIDHGEWEAHIAKVVRFWVTAFRIERVYKGRDFMPAHLRHPHIRAELAPVWLALFEETLAQLCSPKEADAFRAIAKAMMENIVLSLARRDGNAGP
jgi:hemoglobin